MQMNEIDGNIENQLSSVGYVITKILFQVSFGNIPQISKCTLYVRSNTNHFFRLLAVAPSPLSERNRRAWETHELMEIPRFILMGGHDHK